jgi:hypothetical protein
MLRVTIVASGMFFLASTIAASAGGFGFGIVIGPGGIGPGFHSAAPPREYQPRVRSYHEEASRPRRQQRQHANDDEKAEATAPAKSKANENSSIALLTGKPDKAGLHLENSSIASAPHPAEPMQSTILAGVGANPAPNLHLENSSIASAPRPAEPARSATLADLENSSIASAPRLAEPVRSATVAVQAESPVQQAASSHRVVLCSRYFPNPGQTVQVPCE